MVTEVYFLWGVSGVRLHPRPEYAGFYAQSDKHKRLFTKALVYYEK